MTGFCWKVVRVKVVVRRVSSGCSEVVRSREREEVEVVQGHRSGSSGVT